MNAITASRLCKRYGSTLALDSLDLTVGKGEVYGYLGPNGAGKTTTIRLLLGLHLPTSGRCELFGIDACGDPVAAHRRLAYVAGEPFLWPSMTAAETLEFLANLRGGTDVLYREALIERFRLEPNKKIRALSKGNRQKVQLIAALATRADLLLLDEPTAGLDPLMEVAFRECIKEAKERGQTVFLSSHILSEVEAVCDRVGILRGGKLVDEGTLGELRHLRGQMVEVTFEGPAPSLRPFTGAQPLVLLLPIAASALLIAAAARMSLRRDIGTGRLPARDTATPGLWLLSSPLAQALRSERGTLITWTSCIAVFAVVLGMVAPSISAAGITPSIRREVAKLGSGSILTPGGYVAFVFIFFIVAIALFACAQVGAARHEEAEERLETLLALPVSRLRWLGGRLALAAGGAAVLSAVAGLLTWAGTASQGVAISLPRMLEAAANCLPIMVLFLGIAALAYAIVPRASGGIAYGLVAIMFLWYLVGAITGVPSWLVKATPFAHIGFVPSQPFRVQAALVMMAIGAAAIGAAIALFQRRDLAGA
jgi:ABC-type multidrug transport system ATPase subunit